MWPGVGFETRRSAALLNRRRPRGVGFETRRFAALLNRRRPRRLRSTPKARVSKPTTRAFVVTAVFCSFAMLAGCTADPAPPPPPTPTPVETTPPSAELPAGVSVLVQQEASDVALRRLEVHVTNGTTASIVVSNVGFSSPALARASASGDPRTIDPQQALDFAVLLPGSVCVGERVGPPLVTLDLQLTDQGLTRVSLIPADPGGTVDRITSEDCG